MDIMAQRKIRLFYILSTRTHDFMDRSRFCYCLSTKCRVFVDRAAQSMLSGPFGVARIACATFGSNSHKPYWFPHHKNDNLGCAWAWIAQNSPKLISPTDGSTWNRTWNDGTSPCWAADGRTCRIPPMRLLPCLGIWGIQPFVCGSHILDNQLLMLNRLCHMDQATFDNALIDRCLWITFSICAIIGST